MPRSQGGTLCDTHGDLDAAGFERALRGRLRHYGDRLLADRAAAAMGGARLGQEEWEAPLVALKGLTAAQVRNRDTIQNTLNVKCMHLYFEAPLMALKGLR